MNKLYFFIFFYLRFILLLWLLLLQKQFDNDYIRIKTQEKPSAELPGEPIVELARLVRVILLPGKEIL